MESKLIARLNLALKDTNISPVDDLRNTLAKNPSGAKYRRRVPGELEGLVWHQEEGWGSVEAVAKYHTSPGSHLSPETGVESIAYSLGIRKNGQIVVCNDLNVATWSQGDASRQGDENSEFMSVMFEGFFRSPGVSDPSAGEPSSNQITAGLLLWNCCKDIWGWNDNDLYGHYHFGKKDCPGTTLQTIIESTRQNSGTKTWDFSTTQSRQNALQQLGFYKESLNGIWDMASRAALIQFQLANQLVPDGIWGPLTEKKIIKALN